MLFEAYCSRKIETKPKKKSVSTQIREGKAAELQIKRKLIAIGINI